MSRVETDILIAGAGIAGLVTAIGLADAGFQLIVVDPGTVSRQDDMRSTAYLSPSVALFETLDLWSSLSANAAPLSALRVADSAGDPPELADTRLFTPNDMGADEFGWNILNSVASEALTNRAQAHRNIELRLGTGFERMLVRDEEARVWLSDGGQVSTRLVIGADGRASRVREAAGIDATSTRYGQKALAFVARHSAPHDGVSTEIYNSGGAFTTVPMPDNADGAQSAIVWMAAGRDAVDLANAEAIEFNEELNKRSLGLLGDMTRASSVNIWPVVSQRAKNLTSPRVALMAEAAHVFPPIGAQGLNSSMRDVSSLIQNLTGATDPGNAAILKNYAKERARDIEIRAGAIDAFNRICLSGNPMVQAARTAGLRAAHDIAPLRKALMQAGLGGR